MRFRLLAIAISVFALLGTGPASGQQAWPSKPIHFIVPYAAGGTPEAFGAFIRSETEKWAKVVQKAGIRPE
jgi:tripartite-type tricarboxylate transporter receptor subunit TctC